MKKLMISFCCIISAVCLFFLSACTFSENEPTENEKQTSGKIGDTLINSDGTCFCIESCENTKQLGSGFLADTTENNFILLTIRITNNSNKKQTFDDSCVD